MESIERLRSMEILNKTARTINLQQFIQNNLDGDIFVSSGILPLFVPLCNTNNLKLGCRLYCHSISTMVLRKSTLLKMETLRFIFLDKNFDYNVNSKAIHNFIENHNVTPRNNIYQNLEIVEIIKMMREKGGGEIRYIYDTNLMFKFYMSQVKDMSQLTQK